VSTPTHTNGPVYRPTEFRELRIDPIPPPRRNYTPGPERIPLDSRTGGSVPRVSTPTPAPRKATGLTAPTEAFAAASRARGLAKQNHKPRGVHPDSVAGRVMSVLATAEGWLSAHEIYLVLREQGRHVATSGYAAVTGGKAVSQSIGWHVARGRIWERPSDRPEASPKHMKSGVHEYRLATLAAQEARDER
jgi:hypothetical protein